MPGARNPPMPKFHFSNQVEDFLRSDSPFDQPSDRLIPTHNQYAMDGMPVESAMTCASFLSTSTPSEESVYFEGVENGRVRTLQNNSLEGFYCNDYSRKVFVGKVPHYVTSTTEFGMALEHIFRRFGNLEIQWPKPAQYPSSRPTAPRLTGYMFLVFKEQEGLHQLVKRCFRCQDTGEYYLDLGMALESVKLHIRLWRVSDATYSSEHRVMINPTMNTVFLGRLPRMITARDIAHFMQARFQSAVLYVQIDIDGNTNYPQGCAAVFFARYEAFMEALSAQVIDFSSYVGRTWLTEIKPFICFGGVCDDCEKEKPVDFCPDIICLQYYCKECWERIHSYPAMASHKPYKEEGRRTKATNCNHVRGHKHAKKNQQPR